MSFGFDVQMHYIVKFSTHNLLIVTLRVGGGRWADDLEASTVKFSTDKHFIEDFSVLTLVQHMHRCSNRMDGISRTDFCSQILGVAENEFEFVH